MQCCENRCHENFEERYQVIIKNIRLGAGGFYDNIPPSMCEKIKNLFQRRFMYDFSSYAFHQNSKHLRREYRELKKLIKNENREKTGYLINFLYNTCYEINGNQYNDIFGMGIELIKIGKENYLKDDTLKIEDLESNQRFSLELSLKALNIEEDNETYIHRLQCVICLNNEKRIKLNCNHLCLCITCTKGLLLNEKTLNNEKCPICRKDITSIEEIYF